jgi:Calx-beta domain-containing protein/VCBS repeat protein
VLVPAGGRAAAGEVERYPTEPVSISIDSVRVLEGDAGTTAAAFTVRLSAPPHTSGIALRFVTKDGTAKAYADYIPVIGTLPLDARHLSYTIQIPVIGDAVLESDESFAVRVLTLPPGMVFADSVGICTIVNDDEPPSISVDTIRVVEGDAGTVGAAFTVRLSAPLAFPATLDYATEDRTAQAEGDYLPVAGTLALNPAQLSYSIVVPVIGDTIIEGNERFALRLQHPPLGTLFADSVGICTIVNDDRAILLESRAGLRNFLGAVGPAFADANGDGYPDLPLDINQGNGQFSPSVGLSGMVISGFHHGSAWCDYDRDGRPDLVVMPYAEEPSDSMPLQLLHNLGNDAYEDVAPSLGMALIGHGETAVWGDFDGDGWPDLFAPFYPYVPPYRSFLWRNNHDGTFTEMAEAAGVALANVGADLKPEGADAADWNGDGTLDLYAASHLFLNDGTGHFTDVRAQVGLPAVFDEGAKFVDIDCDGDLDLYLRTASGPRLFRNDSGRFTEVTAAAGLPGRPFFWGDSWADVDNDGDMDLLLVNVDPYPMELYLNQGDGTFVSDSAFAAAGHSNFLSAWADVDGDGDLDASIGATDRKLLVNQLDHQLHDPHGWLRVWVLGEGNQADCFGAIARLSEIGGGPGTIQTRVVDGGSGYLAQCEYPLHFAGLGHAHYSLEVRYPGAPGGETVVNGATNPILADLDPDQLASQNLFVFRDGRVLLSPSAGSKALVARPDRPLAGKLSAPSPFPARSTVTVPVRLDGRERADLTVHDVMGRRVRSLARGITGEGSHSIPWDLRDDRGQRCPTGVYFVRLALNGRAADQRPIVVLR